MLRHEVMPRQYSNDRWPLKKKGKKKAIIFPIFSFKHYEDNNKSIQEVKRDTKKKIGRQLTRINKLLVKLPRLCLSFFFIFFC